MSGKALQRPLDQPVGIHVMHEPQPFRNTGRQPRHAPEHPFDVRIRLPADARNRTFPEASRQLGNHLRTVVANSISFYIDTLEPCNAYIGLHHYSSHSSLRNYLS